MSCVFELNASYRPRACGSCSKGHRPLPGLPGHTPVLPIKHLCCCGITGLISTWIRVQCVWWPELFHRSVFLPMYCLQCRELKCSVWTVQLWLSSRSSGCQLGWLCFLSSILNEVLCINTVSGIHADCLLWQLDNCFPRSCTCGLCSVVCWA